MKYGNVVSALMAMALLAPVARALAPAEVLVVANGRVPASTTLARHYLGVRGIPEENLCVIETTDGYAIARPDYETEILEPIRAFLAQRQHDTPIRCICLMWGVPVRVEKVDRLPPEQMVRFYEAEINRARISVAMDRQYLARIGRRFNEPEVNNIEPLAKVFGPPAPPAPRQMPTFKKLRENMETEWNLALAKVGQLTDETKRRIAEQQLLAMQYELRGLAGLISFIQERPNPLVSDPSIYERPLADARAKLEELASDPFAQSVESARVRLQWVRRADGIFGVGVHALSQRLRLKPGRPIDADASVDSELALIGMGDYPLKGYGVNALSFQFAAQAGVRPPPTIMTCRIDGPTPEEALRIIDDSVAVEQTGLRGVAYIDAGLPPKFQNAQGGYIVFDERLRALADLLGEQIQFPTKVDLGPEVFRAGSCPDAAIYIGWYSLRSYVPAFTFVRGAVGFHIASFEAMNLRDPNTHEWCAKLIQNGVVATLGAVNEPTLAAFPDPRPLVLLMLTGDYTMAECYWRTIPMTSWQMTLIADPLYNPYKSMKIVKSTGLEGLMPPADWPPAYHTTGAVRPRTPPAPTTQPQPATAPATQPDEAPTTAPATRPNGLAPTTAPAPPR